MKLGKQVPKTPLGRRVDELHRPPTRFERFRAEGRVIVSIDAVPDITNVQEGDACPTCGGAS